MAGFVRKLMVDSLPKWYLHWPFIRHYYASILHKACWRHSMESHRTEYSSNKALVHLHSKTNALCHNLWYDIIIRYKTTCTVWLTKWRFLNDYYDWTVQVCSIWMLHMLLHRSDVRFLNAKFSLHFNLKIIHSADIWVAQCIWFYFNANRPALWFRNIQFHSIRSRHDTYATFH